MTETVASQQLANARLKQMQEQLQLYQESIKIFHTLSVEYAKAKETVADISKVSVGQEGLIPLSSTLFVPARLTCNSKLCVGLGTGYFAEMNIEQVQDYLSRKLQFLSDKITDLRTMVHNLQMQHADPKVRPDCGDVQKAKRK